MKDHSRHLALFLPQVYGGGAQRSMLKLAGGIAERGYQLDLVLARATGSLLNEVPKSVRLVALNSSRTLTSLPALVRYLRRECPLAMLSAMSYANVVTLWARRIAGGPTRIVVSERNTLSHAIRNAPNGHGRLTRLLVKLFYPWADGIVAVSNGVADDLAQAAGISRECIRVIYNPIITADLRIRATAPLEHPWFAPDAPPVLLAVGRLSPQKDFQTLIQAFAKARKSERMRLLILGEGQERSALEALVNQLGLEEDVSMPGFVANPYPYMSRAALFILSSRWEGLPGALIEALFCGARVIATDCMSGPREILAYGNSGKLVPVGDSDTLADSIRASLAWERPRPFGEWWHEFEVGTVANQYIDALEGSP